MSSSKVMTSVSDSFSFASEKARSNLVEYVRRENIEINKEQFESMLKIIDSSIRQAFVLSSTAIEKSVG